MPIRRLALFLLLNALVLNGMLRLAAPAELGETVLTHSVRVVSGGEMEDDSWYVMGQALDYLQSPAAASVPVYSRLFFEQHQKFQYPVTSLLPFAALQPHVRLVSTCFLALTVIAVWRLVERRLRLPGAPAFGGTPLARLALTAAFALTFYPLVKAFTLGQIQVWLTGLFSAALLAWAAGYGAVAGGLLGLVALVKPHYALFLLWSAARREWRFTITCLAVIVTGLAGSLAVFGWSQHLDYVPVLSFLSQHGESFYPNQSLNGLLNRLAGIGHPELFDNAHSDLFLPPYTPWVYAGTVVSSAVMIALALWPTARRGESARTVDFCLMGLTCTVASPIAWEHHYGILFPIFAVLYTTASLRGAHVIWLTTAYVLASNLFLITNLLASSAWNVVQSYLFAAGLIVLGLLHRRARAAAPARIEQNPASQARG